MKAKVIQTGEIVNVSYYRFDYTKGLAVYKEIGNDRLWFLYDLEFGDKNPKHINWEQRRFELVKAILPQSASIVNEALFRGAKYEGNKSVTEIVAEAAILYADAVIAKLKEEQS